MSILELGGAAYHGGDFSDVPALSKSIISTLLAKSPLHAWTEHPKLNPDFVREDDDKFDLGTVAHALFLEDDGTGVVVLDFPDYRTKAAKEARDYARSLGQIPMLQKHWDDAQALVEGMREGVSRISASPKLFTGGKAEQTLVWEEKGVLFKARFDYLHDDYRAADDLKTTARSAAPERISSLLFANGNDVQAALYQRGLRIVTGVEAEFRFVFVETSPPYAAACYQLSPAALELANHKIDLAADIWRGCLETGKWPGYPTRVMHVEPPAWEETRMYEREYREEGEA